MSLDRFVAAQDAHGTYEQALAELRAGEKRSHWMWFVFPQIDGLGSSEMARRYALTGLEEARRYLDHPVLGARLRECCDALAAAPSSRSAAQILGSIDGMKLRSSLTLFHRAAPGEARFSELLARFFGGEPDPATDERLRARGELA